MKTLLARILCSGARSMWLKDPTLGHYTSETFQHELNLAFHFAAELRNWFPWLDSDFDLSKVDLNRERPDLVLHKRKSNALNFLAIEVKREKRRGDVPTDLKQIRERWFGSHLLYRFGAAVILEDDKAEFEVQILSRQEMNADTLVMKHSNMGEPLVVPNVDCVVLKNLASYIVETAAAGNRPAVQTLQQEMDKLVFGYYGLERHA